MKKSLPVVEVPCHQTGWSFHTLRDSRTSSAAVRVVHTEKLHRPDQAEVGQAEVGQAEVGQASAGQGMVDLGEIDLVMVGLMGVGQSGHTDWLEACVEAVHS